MTRVDRALEQRVPIGSKATPMLSQESLVREMLPQYSNQRELSGSLNDLSEAFDQCRCVLASETFQAVGGMFGTLTCKISM